MQSPNRDPNVEKYRSIRVGNPTFSSKLLPINGAVECLFEMGFEEADTHLVFPKSASLDQLKVIRESIAAQRDQRLNGGQHIHLLTEAQVQSPASSSQAVSSVPTQSSPLVSSVNFFVTLQSNFKHVLLYENSELQQKARSYIPYKLLSSTAEKKMKFAQEAETECVLGKEDFLVLELLRWFKYEFFSWVDCLPCSHCGGPTQNTGSLSPTIDELRWGAQRVENHYCKSCQICTRFPRYNNPEKLLDTRRGRCGEWANCFTLCCRALCLEARYIWDSTDHVWTEIYSVSQRRWLHCDSCENIYDKPLLYEVGWGKRLSYVLAFSRDEVVDVTWRYSCKHPEVMSRRTRVRETWLLHTIIRLNGLRQQSLSVDRKIELSERLLVELVEFVCPRIPKQGELGGRISGSLGWRIAREEMGDANSGTTNQGPCYVFMPTEKEKRDKIIHVLYNTTKDQYCRVSNDFEVIQCWDRCVWSKKSVFRIVENDWDMVYIARTEGSSNGQISWKFDFAPAKLSVKSFSIRVNHQTFKSGDVSWILQSSLMTTNFSGNGRMQSLQCLNGSSGFIVSAQLTGGEGDTSWQHAQLFRQSLKETGECSFEILIHLQNA
ncbi:peptide-N(4)-(N-acetyl-beta-glucosaminyl)asparagine amidase isoform X3 [Syngnathoides biaculeatus]|uniref:peptide-N(4)-(N-acetyl-beta- glucosaminyl)asparagine amidase isoform X3 n=1 Tax=Syngnathoides biaculeatus TaxID=300417 RepID=UPI002ADD6B29|nr:peptide-N(4)-(N-acetyl-beta-glucosaminyl)asparagine amidase isoform X3 [Syngnathoides biaculeatus]